EVVAQDRQGTVRANGRHTNVEQTSHPDPGRWSRHGCDEDLTAIDNRRERSRPVCECFGRRSGRMPQISRADVGAREQFCQSGAWFETNRGSAPCGFSVIRNSGTLLWPTSLSARKADFVVVDDLIEAYVLAEVQTENFHYEHCYC